MDEVSLSAHAVRIVVEKLAETMPVPDVGPPHLGRHHRHTRGPLHHALIDRHLRQSWPYLSNDLILLCSPPGGSDLSDAEVQSRLELRKFIQEGTNVPDEHACVPQ